jgi:hypothetical protein
MPKPIRLSSFLVALAFAPAAAMKTRWFNGDLVDLNGFRVTAAFGARF